MIKSIQFGIRIVGYCIFIVVIYCETGPGTALFAAFVAVAQELQQNMINELHRISAIRGDGS